MEPAAPPAPSWTGNDDDDFYWDAAAEAELQAVEAAYAAESAKRRCLPYWSSPAARPASPVRPRPSPVSAASPSSVLSPPTCRGEAPGSRETKEPSCFLEPGAPPSWSYAEAIEAAYAAESAKCRRLPDWSNTAARPAAPVRPRPNPVPAASPSSVLSPPTCRGNVKARHQQIAFSGKIVYCRTRSEVEKATVEIWRKIKTNASGQVSFGFDLEWRPFPRRGEPPSKVALMQLCMDKTHCYLMHIIHSGVPPLLKSLLEDSSSVKSFKSQDTAFLPMRVGVCIDNDARKMFNDYDVRVQPLMDLSPIANAKIAGPQRRWSLAALTEMMTCKELPKPSNIRMGNWEACVLSKQQLQYAATDAYISWYLYEVLQSLPDYDVDDISAATLC